MLKCYEIEHLKFYLDTNSIIITKLQYMHVQQMNQEREYI